MSAHDIATIDRFLTDLAQCPDLTDLAADGGVTVGMVFQQEARWMRTLLARVLHEVHLINDIHIKTLGIVVEAGHAYRARAVAAETALAERTAS